MTQNTPKPTEHNSLLASLLAVSAQQQQDHNKGLNSLLTAFAFRKESQYFLNQTVYIDDYTFVKCRFDNCRLVTYKGTFKFEHSVLDATTTILYGGEALKIVKLFNSKSPFSTYFPDLKVSINMDGTFSLE